MLVLRWASLMLARYLMANEHLGMHWRLLAPLAVFMPWMLIQLVWLASGRGPYPALGGTLAFGSSRGLRGGMFWRTPRSQPPHDVDVDLPG
jgi:hypothetical protein